MAATDLEICNLALARLGVKASIFSLTDGTAEANMCNAMFAPARDEALEGFPWPFATKRSVLTLVTPTDVRTAWAYTYLLPSDCIAPRFIHPGSRVVPYNARIPFAIEAGLTTGKVLLTDQAAAELVYTARMTDVSGYPPSFSSALAWLMGRDLAVPLGGTPQTAMFCVQMASAAFAQAGGNAFRQSQEDPPNQIQGEYINARGNLPATTTK